MKNTPKHKTVAQSQPLLYAYVAWSLILTIISVVTVVHTKQRILQRFVSDGDNLSTANTIYSMIFFFDAVISVFILYLIISRDIKKVRIILKVFLAMDLLHLIIDLASKHTQSPRQAIVTLADFGFTYYLLRLTKKLVVTQHVHN